MEALYEFGAAAVSYLAGPNDLRPEEHEYVMHVAADVVAEESPLFKDDPTKERTLSFVLAVAYREGGLRAVVRGDCTKSKPGEPCKGRATSFCSMQINESIGGSERLNDDPHECFRVGIRTLRQSMRFCPSLPVAWYAVGGEAEKACASVRGKRISTDRMALAQRIMRAISGQRSAVSERSAVSNQTSTASGQRSAKIKSSVF